MTFLAVPLVVLAALQDGMGWDEFPVFVWRQEYRGRALPEALAEAFGGTNVERGESIEWMEERPLAFYVGHAPGRNDLHLRRDEAYTKRFDKWYASRDERLLVREPCLTDPVTRARLFETLEVSLAARDGNHGLGISLGDEVSLTPWGDPSDVCRSETCEEAWKEYAAERDLPERAPTTDEVRLSFGDGNTSLLGAWLARRRFHQDVVIGLLEELAARARELAPGVPIGLLGLGGRTAFGGVAVERAAEFLDFLEPYRTDDARELFATRRRGDQRVLTTVFADRAGPSDAAWQMWEHFLRGGDGAVVWSDRILAGDDRLRERLAQAAADIRTVQREIGAFRPRTSGAAIVHSPDSIALAWLRDALLDGPTWPNRLARYQRENGVRERSLDSWLRVFEDVGILPGSIPVDEIGAATAERFSVLVLSHVEVLSDDEFESIERYLGAGGRIAVEGALGRFDENGRLRGGRLRSLERAFSESILRPPDGLTEYEQERTRLIYVDFGWDTTGEESPRGQLVVEAVGAWFSRPWRAPFRITGSWTSLWLQAYERRPEGDVCVAITNDGSASYYDFEIEVPEGHRVEWIHPPEGEDFELEASERNGVKWMGEDYAGGALVFRVLPK